METESSVSEESDGAEPEIPKYSIAYTFKQYIIVPELSKIKDI